MSSVTPEMADQARKLLVSTRVDDLKAGGGQSAAKLTLLRDRATVEQTLSELAQRRILSAPVVSSSGEDVEEDVMGPTHPPGSPADDTLGFIDVRDIVCSFLQGGSWRQGRRGMWRSRRGADLGGIHGAAPWHANLCMGQGAKHCQAPPFWCPHLAAMKCIGPSWDGGLPQSLSALTLIPSARRAPSQWPPP
jgi:hypothetical protein